MGKRVSKSHVHTHNDICVFLGVCHVSQGPVCLYPETLLKRNCGNVTALQRKPNLLSFASFSFVILSILIEYLALNNAVLPLTPSLCREPTSFILIFLHLKQKRAPLKSVIIARPFFVSILSEERGSVICGGQT